MEYKVGDKVRVRGDLEVGKTYGGVYFISSIEKNKFFEVLSISENGSCTLDDEFRLYYSSEMLRPAEFKIWCETEEEKQAVLEELEKEGYKDSEKINEVSGEAPVGFFIEEDNNYSITFFRGKGFFGDVNIANFTPSEFTRIDFSEKIVITKTPTGATAIYKDKTVTTEGEFEDAARQALAEALCPFKVGDRVKHESQGVGTVTNKILRNDYKYVIGVYFEDVDYHEMYLEDDLELYTEPPYNAKLFCIKNCGRFETGHIYEVKNGVFTDGNPNHTMTVSNINELNERFGEHDECYFMEVKGGLND